MEKGQKPEPGKQNDKGKLKISIKVPSDSESYKKSPWSKFEEIGNFSPPPFRELTELIP